jgi:hypothetical protein
VIYAARAFGVLFLLIGVGIFLEAAFFGVHASRLLIGAAFLAIGVIRLRAAGVGAGRPARRRR